ncbi:MAG: TIGR00266 family protein [Actinomycetia bacterium]|nr:TIGR00266 family protein [Actinomycetes bacterium]
MHSEIKFSPSFASAEVTLSPGEACKAEAGAMLGMAGVEIETSTQGGLMKGLKRSVLGGESFFMNTFTAGNAGGTVTFAPTLPGDIVSWQLTGQTVYLQSGAYLASAMGIEVDTKFGGGKTFFSSEGLFILKCSGHGELLVSSYGAIDAKQLAAGESYTVDTGHMVGWSEGVQYNVRKVGNWKSTFLSGEGLVVDLTGPGMIYTQTRSQDAFLDWLLPKIPSSSS